MPTDKIRLNGIQFYGYHGVSDEEQATGRLYEVDVELPYDCRAAGRSDAITDTVNYRELFEIVMLHGTQKRFRLLEALGHQIAGDILARTGTSAVCVRICKLQPPLPVVMASAEVEILRASSDFEN